MMVDTDAAVYSAGRRHLRHADAVSWLPPPPAAMPLITPRFHIAITPIASYATLLTLYVITSRISFIIRH